MSKYKVGDIIHNPKNNHIMQILEVLEHKNSYNYRDLSSRDFVFYAYPPMEVIDRDYILYPVYNTPLWRLLNE